MCNESCHRFTFALFTGVVAASSSLRQEIGALDDNIKAKLLVSHRYVDTSNILVVQARFHRTTNTQQQSWEPLHGLRNNGASRRTRRLTASRIGGKIWFILCHSTLTSLHFSPMALLGQRKLRPSPYAVSLMTEKQYRSPDVKQPVRKLIFLDLTLGQIANYCPVISRNTLLKNSTSIQSVWNMIREHFGFQITIAHFLDFANLHLEADERPEDLFQRLMAFVEDSLRHANSLSHHGDVTTEDEELTPTLENFIVLTWLRLIHPELPKLVKQRYGTELRSRTLASIKPEISQALTSLLDEIRTTHDAKIMRTAVSGYRKPIGNRSQYKVSTRPNRPSRSCPLCKQANWPEHGHFLRECSFLPEQDRRYITKVRQIADIFDDPADPDTRPYADEPDSDTDDPGPSLSTHVFRIQTRQSPYLDMFHAHHPVRITIDSGATGNMIRHTVVQRLGCRVTPSSQSVHQADGSSPLHVVGETR